MACKVFNFFSCFMINNILFDLFYAIAVVMYLQVSNVSGHTETFIKQEGSLTLPAPCISESCIKIKRLT